MLTLSEIALKYTLTDKNSVHSYLPVYEELLAPYRNGSLLEIGLFHGASMRMFEEYFDKVYGIDCSETPHDGLADLRPLIKEGNHNIYIMDATDESVIRDKFFSHRFDVIIDDAGHHIDQQLNLYHIWKNYLSPNGIYIIEDIQDIKKTQHLFIELGFKIIDLRNNKGRYDDVLAIKG